MTVLLALALNLAAAADWDPGFEETETSPWTSWGSSFDTSNPHSGARALRLTVAVDGTQAGAYQDAVVPAVPGETVRVGGWFAEPSDGGLSEGGDAYLQLEVFGEAVSADARSTGFTDGTWTCVVAEIEVPEGVETVRTVILLDDPSGDSSVLVDDLVVTTDGWDPCTPRPAEDTDVPEDTDVAVEDTDAGSDDTDAPLGGGADTDDTDAAADDGGCGCVSGGGRQVGLVAALVGLALARRRR